MRKPCVTRVTGVWFQVFGDAPLKIKEQHAMASIERCWSARKETKVHRLSQVRM